MRRLIDRFRPVWSPDEPAGGEPAGGEPAGGEPAGGGQPGAGAPGEAPGAAEPGGQPPAPAGQSYRPEGLPETMYGANDRETMDKMVTALKGYRERDTNRQVPSEPDAYKAFDLEQMPETVRGQIGELAQDPLFDAVAATAHAEGVPVPTLHKLTAALYEAGANAGLFEDFVDPAKERAALLPEGAQALPKADQDKAIDARMTENENFVKLMMANGKLPPEAGEHALLMLMDTANGNQFIEWVRNKVDAGPGPLLDGGVPPGTTAESLQAELAKPEMQTGNPKFNKQAYEDLMKRYQAFHGE